MSKEVLTAFQASDVSKIKSFSKTYSKVSYEMYEESFGKPVLKVGWGSAK